MGTRRTFRAGRARLKRKRVSMNNQYREPTDQDIESVVEVSDDGKKWCKRKLVHIANSNAESRFTVIEIGSNVLDPNVALTSWNKARIKLQMKSSQTESDNELTVKRLAEVLEKLEKTRKRFAETIEKFEKIRERYLNFTATATNESHRTYNRGVAAGIEECAVINQVALGQQAEE